MDRIYDDAKDKNVRANCVYGTAEDTALYIDSECKTQIKTSELKEIFKKGCVVSLNGGLCKAISYTESEGIGSVIIVKPDTTDSVVAVFAKFEAAKDE